MNEISGTNAENEAKTTAHNDKKTAIKKFNRNRAGKFLVSTSIRNMLQAWRNVIASEKFERARFMETGDSMGWY